MKPILRPFYIFALNTNDELEDHILMHNKLSRSQFKILQGMYKGESETSYLVDADFKDLAFKLGKEYDQESILYVDENRDAYLLYLNSGAKAYIGKWQAVSNVKNMNAYTVDLTTGQAYAAL